MIRFAAPQWRSLAIHVDHALSWECGHVGDMVFTNRDTMQHAAQAAIRRRSEVARDATTLAQPPQA